MDNSFEQQFAQNLRQTAPTGAPAPAPAPVQPTDNSINSKLPWIVSIVLAAVVLVESFALVVALTNYFDTFYSSDEAETEDEYYEGDSTDYNYVYDNDDNLSAINAICTDDNGARYDISTKNSYRKYDSSSTPVSSGSYSIYKDSIMNFTDASGQKTTLFYDGYILTDGVEVYDCEEPEATTEEATTGEDTE